MGRRRTRNNGHANSARDHGGGHGRDRDRGRDLHSRKPLVMHPRGNDP